MGKIDSFIAVPSIGHPALKAECPHFHTVSAATWAGAKVAPAEPCTCGPAATSPVLPESQKTPISPALWFN